MKREKENWFNDLKPSRATVCGSLKKKKGQLIPKFEFKSLTAIMFFSIFKNG
jgi:hypothetical protein